VPSSIPARHQYCAAAHTPSKEIHDRLSAEDYSSGKHPYSLLLRSPPHWHLNLIGSTSIPTGGQAFQATFTTPPRRVEVPQLLLRHHGIEAENPQGERILDVHHAAHSDAHNEGDNAISIGFTSHNAQMRARFGEHMQVDIASENILIASEEQFWLDDLGQQIIIQDPNGERQVVLDVIKFAAPCEEFSH